MMAQTDSSFRSKVAIVTGAARGIGFETARQLACAGACVALVDLCADPVSEAAAKLQAVQCDVMPIVADISKGCQVQAAVKTVMERWGHIDILVNNAGICPITPFAQTSEEEWDQVLAVNLKGAFLFSQAVSSIMKQQHCGKIVSIASSAGQMGGLAVGVHYAASKAGILGLTKTLARLLAPDVQVNAVSPGTTESEMTRDWTEAAKSACVGQIPLRRMGRPADTAAAVVFLASDSAGFVTGQTLAVNGGLFMA